MFRRILSSRHLIKVQPGSTPTVPPHSFSIIPISSASQRCASRIVTSAHSNSAFQSRWITSQPVLQSKESEPKPTMSLDEKIDSILNHITSSTGRSSSSDFLGQHRAGETPSASSLQKIIEEKEITAPEVPEDVKHLYRFGATEEELEQVSPMVRKLFSMVNASQSEINQARKQLVLQKWGRFPSDSGVTEVQVANLSLRISNLTAHLHSHRKDFDAKRRIQMLVHARRKLLQYLKRKAYPRYKLLRETLGIRPV